MARASHARLGQSPEGRPPDPSVATALSLGLGARSSGLAHAPGSPAALLCLGSRDPSGFFWKPLLLSRWPGGRSLTLRHTAPTTSPTLQQEEVPGVGGLSACHSARAAEALHSGHRALRAASRVGWPCRVWGGGTEGLSMAGRPPAPQERGDGRGPQLLAGPVWPPHGRTNALDLCCSHGSPRVQAQAGQLLRGA